MSKIRIKIFTETEAMKLMDPSVTMLAFLVVFTFQVE